MGLDSASQKENTVKSPVNLGTDLGVLRYCCGNHLSTA